MSTAPTVHLDLAEFWQDPYPALRAMRAHTPIAYVPELRRTLLTRLDDIKAAEPDIATFSSSQPEGLMTMLLGENLMRKDGAAHMVERKAIFPTVSPRAVRDTWTAQFRDAAAKVINDLGPSGSGDLFTGFATRLSGEALRILSGVFALTWQEMDQTSQAMIDGIANYTGDKTVEAACHAATAKIDAAIDATPAGDGLDMLSVMRRAGLPDASIRANIKLTITGGQNEPRDVIAGLIWALLTHPEQLQLLLDGKVAWIQAFEEYVRWLSPIGMSPRRIARDASLSGVDFATGDDVFFMLGSANHDEKHFQNPQRFDVTRDASKHIAFGAGPHFCAGAWASKALVAEVALPMLFDALPDLRLTGEPVRLGGWAFRGVLNLPCAWGPL